LMKSGVEILGKKTKECDAEKISEYCFRIVLTEGRNRQIRRMCYKLGFDVVQLKRVRIGKLVLGDLEPGDLLQVNQIER
jgi:23S rRNA pseudouridine2604 synthase